METIEQKINEFLIWNAKRVANSDENSEEFLQAVSKQKEEFINGIDRVMEIGNTSQSIRDCSNPFIPLFSMILFSPKNAQSTLRYMIENKVGHELTEEQYNEYVNITLKMNATKSIIDFLNNDKIDESLLSPILKNMIRIKEHILPVLSLMELSFNNQLK